MNGPTPPEEIKGRRVKRLRIGPSFFPMAFQSGLVFEIQDGVPPGAQFRGYAHDPERNELVIFIEHESFEWIPFANQAPEMILTVTKRQLPNV